MTRMPREEFAPARKEALRHLHAVLGVEGSETFAGCNQELPYRVREHYIDTFQAALRSLPMEQYPRGNYQILYGGVPPRYRHKAPSDRAQYRIESAVLGG